MKLSLQVSQPRIIGLLRQQLAQLHHVILMPPPRVLKRRRRRSHTPEPAETIGALFAMSARVLFGALVAVLVAAAVFYSPPIPPPHSIPIPTVTPRAVSMEEVKEFVGQISKVAEQLLNPFMNGDCVTVLSRAGPDATPKYRSLHKAAKNNDIKTACLLLKAGQNVNEFE